MWELVQCDLANNRDDCKHRIQTPNFDTTCLADEQEGRLILSSLTAFVLLASLTRSCSRLLDLIYSRAWSSQMMTFEGRCELNDAGHGQRGRERLYVVVLDGALLKASVVVLTDVYE